MSRRVTFVIGAEWVAGPVTFLRRACAGLRNFGWEPHLVLTGLAPPRAFTGWPCPVTNAGSAHSYAGFGRKVGRAILRTGADVMVATYDRGTPFVMQYLYREKNSEMRLAEMLHADLPSEFERVAALADVTASVLVINEDVKRRLSDRVPALKDRVFRWYCPVPCRDDPPGAPLHSPLRLIFAGRVIQHEKRALDMVPIARALLRRGLQFQFTVAGNGPDLLELQGRVAADAELAPRFHFAGWLPEAELCRILAQQDIFLLPSEAESMGFSLLEAMGQGCVPIVTGLPGPREVVNASNGAVVPVGDHEAFAAAVQALAEPADGFPAMRQAAWNTARESFEVSAALRRYADALDATLRLPLPEGRLRYQAPPAWNTKMDRLGVPAWLQTAKRFLRRQFVTP